MGCNVIFEEAFNENSNWRVFEQEIPAYRVVMGMGWLTPITQPRTRSTLYPDHPKPWSSVKTRPCRDWRVNSSPWGLVFWRKVGPTQLVSRYIQRVSVDHGPALQNIAVDLSQSQVLQSIYVLPYLFKYTVAINVKLQSIWMNWNSKSVATLFSLGIPSHAPLLKPNLAY